MLVSLERLDLNKVPYPRINVSKGLCSMSPSGIISTPPLSNHDDAAQLSALPLLHQPSVLVALLFAMWFPPCGFIVCRCGAFLYAVSSRFDLQKVGVKKCPYLRNGCSTFLK